MDQALISGQGYSPWLLPTLVVHLDALAIVLVAGMIAYVVARWVLRGIHVALESGTTFLLLLLALDPYSFGGHGGDVGFEIRMWQSVATLFLVLLLAAVLMMVRRRRMRLAGSLAVLELLVFLGLNLAYIARDGFWTRALRGFASSPLPLFAIVFGVAVRAAVVAKLRSMNGASPGRAVESLSRQ